jgi:ribosomal protein S18 acetylase RimI-like enzyme
MLSGRSILACTPAEYSAVIDLVNAAYRGQGGQNGWTHEIGLVDGLRITPERLRGILTGEGEPIIYLLREADVLRACVHLEDSRGRAGEPACHISMLAVRPGLQDQGLGRLMLDYAEAQGRNRGALLARMTVVSVRESLIAWYERRGYRRTGETQPFPYDAPLFGAPQRPDLEFVVLEKKLET